MNEHLTFDEFLDLPPEQQRQIFERQKNEAAKKRKYGLYWDDARHREDVVARCENEMPVLEEAEDRRIHYTPPAADLFDTPDRPQPTHLLIEGDNYHALSVLNYTHRAKIDLIYIDPPYNTGNRDFRYNDNFVDREDGDRHTKWLSFMQRRLELAKHLLKDSGVIFISIDDNEVAQLKLLCDKVFGEGNFVGIISWFKKRKGSFLSKSLISLSEYLLVYSKDATNVKLYGSGVSTEESQPIIKRTNSKKTLTFPAAFVKTKLKDGIYEKGTYGEGTSASVLLNDIQVIEGTIINEFSIEAPFVWSQDFLENEIENGTEILINTINLQPRAVRINSNSVKAFPSFLDGRQFAATNEDAYDLLKEIFLTERPFNYSKPINLIKKITEAVTFYYPNAIILDFFAGSGTTGHAVLEMNKEDGGRRQFILVTNNEVTDKTRRQLEAEGKSPADIEEMGICRAVTYPRLQRVVEGYVNPKGEKVAGTGGKLRYFRTGFVPAEGSSDQLCYNLRRRCTEMLCFRENVFDPLASGGQWEIFRDHDRVLAILHDEHPRHRDALRDALRALEGVSGCKLYVFTLDRDVNAADYADFQNVVLENVPAKIIDLYKREVQRLSAVQAELAS